MGGRPGNTHPLPETTRTATPCGPRASVIITVDSDDDAEMEEVSKRQTDESRERREKKAKKKRDEAQQRQSRKQSGIEAFLTRKPD